MKHLRIAGGILLVLAILITIYFFMKTPQFSITKVQEKENYTEYKIVFKSDGKDIYGLLFMPKGRGNVPAAVVLPASAGTKESRDWYGKMLVDEGYASLILDQRGIGETGGNVPNFQQDYESYLLKKQVFQDLFVRDALQAAAILSNIEDINKDKIAIIGESMGGRFAIIAAAKDTRIKTAFIIASAGYKSFSLDYQFNAFLDYVNPNTYVPLISPRKIVMFHSENDTVIPLSDVQITFGRALEPKELIVVHGCEHGYCDEMYSSLHRNLQELLNS